MVVVSSVDPAAVQFTVDYIQGVTFGVGGKIDVLRLSRLLKSLW